MLKKLRKMLKKQEGFTLVELMIVVVILGILAGIGVQQYANVQQRAKEAADKANRKVLTNATNMWLILGSAPTEAGSRPSRKTSWFPTIWTSGPTILWTKNCVIP